VTGGSGKDFAQASAIPVNDPPRIAHEDVQCVVAGRYPRLKACFTPADTVPPYPISRVIQGRIRHNPDNE
jgi:hypothetical protein